MLKMLRLCRCKNDTHCKDMNAGKKLKMLRLYEC